jgi:reverse transcriptase-like protein
MAFLTTLLPASSSTMEPERPSLVWFVGHTSRWDWPETLDPSEVKNAIFSSSAKKAPGSDSLGFAAIQHAYTANSAPFLALYGALFIKGYHPDCWKDAIEVIIPKATKPSYSVPKSYQIVSLLNCLSKVLEKIYATRLAYIANMADLLDSSQLGGRKQRSAIDAIMLLLHYIQQQKAARKSNITTTILLDIKGAFDYISKPKLLEILRSLQLPETFCSWVSAFLTGRRIQLLFDGQIQQQKMAVSTGIPQGSPISPILFLIYIRNIATKASKAKAKEAKGLQMSYMDDFSYSVSSTSAAKNCRALATIFQELMASAAENGAEFAAEKTELIHFSTRRQPITEGITVAGVTITPKPVVRWLGVFLDSKLTFKPHIQRKAVAATAAFQRLQSLGNTQRGLSTAALRQLYLACVTTIADFGAQLWWKGSQTHKSHFKPLEQLQNRALLRILGAYKGSPSRALEVEGSIMPVSIRLEKLYNSYNLQILWFLLQHQLKTILYSASYSNQLEDKVSENIPIFRILEPKTQLLATACRLQSLVPYWALEAPSAHWKTPWSTRLDAEIEISDLPKSLAAKAHLQLLKTLNIDLEFDLSAVYYMDGSQKPSGLTYQNAASACRIGLRNSVLKAYSWNLGIGVEIADAEIFAVVQVLKLAASALTTHPKTLYIFVDSQAAILKLRGYTEPA